MNLLSISTVTVLSTYVIISSVILVAFVGQLSPINEKWLNIINIAISVGIIAFSLIEFSKDYLGAAEAMNQSALRIGELYGWISSKLAAGSLSEDELQEGERKYAAILREYPENHDPIDYDQFKLNNPSDFKYWWSSNWIFSILTQFILYCRYYWIYAVAMTIFPALVIVFGGTMFAVSHG